MTGRLISDAIIRDALRGPGDRVGLSSAETEDGCNYWVVRIRDPALRKNAKPIALVYHQTAGGGLLNAVEETVEFYSRQKQYDTLEAIVIEARRMTKREVEKWDLETDRAERRADRAERNRPLWSVGRSATD